MEEIQQKIHALHKVNEEIIARIEGVKEVKHFEYSIHPDDSGFLVLHEDLSVRQVGDVVVGYKFEGKFVTDIWDVFNDKPNYVISSWSDLKRLNKDLLGIVEKFDLLDKSNPKAIGELGKYVKNFEAIHEGLGRVEEKTLSQTSRKDDLHGDIDRINESIKSLIQKGVTVGPGRGFADTFLNGAQSDQLRNWFGGGWKLLYRGSRDGFSPQAFHTRCDNEGPTITVVHCANGAICGGFTRQPWSSTIGFFPDPFVELFSLSSAPVQRPAVRCPATPTAFPGIVCAPGEGPLFGGDPRHFGVGRYDLRVNLQGQAASLAVGPLLVFQDRTGTLVTLAGSLGLKEVEVFGLE